MNNYFLVLLASAAVAQGSVYVNTFDDAAALSGFTIYGEQFIGYYPPALHTVGVSGGQLVIETSYLQPNYPSTAPTLFGQATLSLSTSSWGPAFNPTLSQNVNGVSWSFNVANQDGAFNNGFYVVLACSEANPFNSSAHGYFFNGGGMVGNRMALRRFDHGLWGQTVVVDVADGLGTMPQTGSFRIEFTPANNQWKLFGTMGPSYQDATQVSSLLGSGTDGTYTGQALPYFALGGNTTGTDYFDNLVVDVPEPGTGRLGALAGALLWGWARLKKTRQQLS